MQQALLTKRMKESPNLTTPKFARLLTFSDLRRAVED